MIGRRDLLTAAAGLALSAAPAVATPGAAARLVLPELRGGRDVRLTDYRGRIVYLDFWASWCTACIVSMPELSALQAAYAGAPFQLLSVGVDRDRAAGLAFFRRVKADYPAGWDPDAATMKAFGVTALPTGLLIDASGGIRTRTTGYIRGQDRFLKAHIDQLLREQALGIVRAAAA